MSLKDQLDLHLTDPLKQNQLIAKALDVLAQKLDDDLDVGDTDYKAILNAITLG